MKYSKFLIFPVLLISAVAGFFLFQQLAVTPTSSLTPTPIPTPAPIAITQTVWVNIAYSPDHISHYSQNYTASDSALSILQSIGVQAQIPIAVKTYPFGTLIESIGGYKNTSDQAWIYFVNDKSASVSADNYPIRPGDIIEWKYVKPF